MLKLTVLEFFVRGIPEAFLFIFAAYAISKIFIDIKRYILSSILIAIIVYSIRLLPIQYGVNTILNLIALIIIIISINKIDIIKAIQTGIITIILEYICEAINVLIIQYIFKVDINIVFKDPLLKILYGIPSTLIFTSIVLTYYLILYRRKELRNVSNREDIK